MSELVMKFGGTSVGNAERIREAAQIVSNHAKENRVVVVVSAIAGITDMILKALNAATNGAQSELEGHLQQIEAVHRNAINGLFETARVQEVLLPVNEVLGELREFCSALLMLHSLTPQVMDAALPMGEQMSAMIFAAYLQQLGANGINVDSARVIVTDDKFGDANPDMEATRKHAKDILLPMLKRGAIPVVTGYRAATIDNRPTTLGRGGSDYSATILGAAIASDEVWIWTDVDGVLSADPRICANARTLPDVTYAEAIELSYYGAKVIHPKAVMPAMDSGLPVWIKNTFRSELPGTKIVATLPSSGAAVKAVSAVKRASLVTLSARHDIHFAELFGRLFLRLGHEHLDVLLCTQSSSESALGLVLREQDAEHVVTTLKRLFRQELKHGILNPIEVQHEIGVVAVMGQSMKGVRGILGRLFTRVSECNVSVIALAQGASELNICFAVPSAAVDDVVHAVHDEFITQPPAKSSLSHFLHSKKPEFEEQV